MPFGSYLSFFADSPKGGSDHAKLVLFPLFVKILALYQGVFNALIISYNDFYFYITSTSCAVGPDFWSFGTVGYSRAALDNALCHFYSILSL